VHRQKLMFMSIGALATALQYLVLELGTDYLIWPTSFAAGVGYLAGAVLSYFLNYFFTFVSDKPHVQSASRFMIMVGIGWCFTMIFMTLLVDYIGWNKWWAQIIISILVLVFNYLISRTWVFSRINI